MEQGALIKLVAEQAQRWADPELPVRRDAVERTLACENVFTREAIDFAVDQQMSELTTSKLLAWVNGRRAEAPGVVAVLGAGNLPLVDLQDWLAVALSGHRYIGVNSSRSPYLLKAFSESVVGSDQVHFSDFGAALSAADRVIATGSDDTIAEVREQFAHVGIDASRMLLRGSGFGVAVLTGNESADQWLDLAEDCLLHEGRGCRNVAVIFAPDGLPPDQFLEAAATFRGVFPAHPRTAGGLAIPKAMLEALGQPCAFADDLSFLVSAGEPEPKEPCHIRWTSYDKLSNAREWIDRQGSAVQIVATELTPDTLGLASGARLVVPLGSAQHPAIDWWPDGVDTIEFLCG